MGRVYYVSFENITVAAAQDLFEVNPAANKPIRLLSVYVYQRTIVGDANESFLRINVKRTTASFVTGSGGAAPTVAKKSPGDPAASFAAEANNTTQSTGTQEILLPHNPNIRIGLEMKYTPEEQPDFINGNPCIIELDTAPAVSLILSGTAVVEEMG